MLSSTITTSGGSSSIIRITRQGRTVMVWTSWPARESAAPASRRKLGSGDATRIFIASAIRRALCRRRGLQLVADLAPPPLGLPGPQLDHRPRTAARGHPPRAQPGHDAHDGVVAVEEDRVDR